MSLALAVAALVAGALPHPGMFVAIGMAIAAAGMGWLGWRRRGAPGAQRLTAAVGLGIAVIALALGGARYAITLFAVTKLTAIVGG
ncbi:MAG TPA: hypothetical protein VM261_26485 [Kofleriaceae bacterium]|nr:hypothetical protein [Kofleriaceae bacterium]